MPTANTPLTAGVGLAVYAALAVATGYAAMRVTGAFMPPPAFSVTSVSLLLAVAGAVVLLPALLLRAAVNAHADLRHALILLTKVGAALLISALMLPALATLSQQPLGMQLATGEF